MVIKCKLLVSKIWFLFLFLSGKNLIHTTAVVKLTLLWPFKIFSIPSLLKWFSWCPDYLFFPQTERMIHALVIKTSLFMYFHESITLRKEILFLHPTSYNQPITAMCLAVNHPSCSNSFCVLSQSAFRPHTHFSIAYKVRCTSLHFIPPSLSLHSSISPFVYFSTWRDLLLFSFGLLV